MSEAAATHATTVELTEPLPPEVAAGADIVLKVKVSCTAGCDLRGMPVTIATADGAVATGELAIGHAGLNETGELALKAPQRAGEQVWTVTCSPHEVAGARHESNTLALPIRTKAHETSLAVWDVPSPVVTGARFEIKVGAKSAAGCDLKGRTVAIRDDAGAVVASACLGDTPWPDTRALYWTTVELLAPAATGLASRTVTFDAAELALAHSGTASRFSLAVVKPPEHRLTVKVVERESQAPIENAQVLLGVYRASTDRAGLAAVSLPKGDYDLTVWKAGHDALPTAVHIDTDVTIRIEATIVPEENPDDAWKM